jgi:anthranilate phosphoribosyltransferase
MMLSLSQSETLFGQMLDGEMPDDAIKATLIAMAERDETAEEIAGAVKAMRARMIRVMAPANAIDVNVSTAVAIVVAACDVPVAKHGNRAASSKAGGADTLEALGLNLDRAAETAEETLADLGIAFLFAQKYHPALARIAPIRKDIGRRTIFNLTGPACNPAGVKRQLIGVARPDFMPVYAGALELLGYDDVMLVAGDEPLDELSISGGSSVVRIGLKQPPFPNRSPEPVEGRFQGQREAERRASTGSALRSAMPNELIRITPETAGLPRHSIEALKGGDATYNAAALHRLLDGEAGAYRDAVLLNSAAALMVAGEARDWQDGVEEAAEAIDKGLAKALLECWINF